MHTATAAGSTVILAVDPDADRLAVAEKNPETDSWKVFSGNELGNLMGWWAFKNYKERHPHFDGEYSLFAEQLLASSPGHSPLKSGLVLTVCACA